MPHPASALAHVYLPVIWFILISTHYTFSSRKNNLTVNYAELRHVWFDPGSEELCVGRIRDCTGGEPDSL